MPAKETDSGTPADRMLAKLEALNARVDEIKKEQSVCYGEECNRLDNVLKAVEQQKEAIAKTLESLKAIVGETISAAVDDKIAVIETRTNEIKSSIDNFNGGRKTNGTSENEDVQELDENCYIECPTCGQPLDLTKKSCKHCKTVIDWDVTLNNIARE